MAIKKKVVAKKVTKKKAIKVKAIPVKALAKAREEMEYTEDMIRAKKKSRAKKRREKIENMPKFASIEKCTYISYVHGYDWVYLALVGNKYVIVRTDEIKNGDHCVLVQYGARMPKLPEFNFLAKRGYKIKPYRLAGILSQAIAFPLSVALDKTLDLKSDLDKVLGIRPIKE